MSSAPASEVDVQRLIAYVTEVRRLASRAAVPSAVAADRPKSTGTRTPYPRRRLCGASANSRRSFESTTRSTTSYSVSFGRCRKTLDTVMIPCTKFAMFEGEAPRHQDLVAGVGAIISSSATPEEREIIERRRNILRAKIRDADHNARAMESRFIAARHGGINRRRRCTMCRRKRRSLRTVARESRTWVTPMVETTEVYEAGDAEQPSRRWDRVRERPGRRCRAPLYLDNFISRA